MVVSVIDLGDMHLGLTEAELAIAAAYALLGKNDSAAAADVVGGYHEVLPLDREPEIALPTPSSRRGSR